MNILEKIALRFISGNSVPIDRAYITKTEWEEISSALQLRNEIYQEIYDLGDEGCVIRDRWLVRALDLFNAPK